MTEAEQVNHNPQGRGAFSMVLEEHGYHLTLSKSFLSDWRMCPSRAMANQFNPQPAGEAALRGTLHHAAAEAIFAGKASDIERLYMEATNQPCPDDDEVEDAYLRAYRVVAELQDKFTILSTEESKALRIENWLTIKGTTDLILRDRNTGMLYVGDYKTGKKFKEEWRVARYGADQLVYCPLNDIDGFVYVWFDAPPGKTLFVIDGDKEDYRHRLLSEASSVYGTLRHAMKDGHETRGCWLEDSNNLPTEARASMVNDVPKNPSDWWCSERWCSRHREGECMGATQTIYPDEVGERKAIQLTKKAGDTNG